MATNNVNAFVPEVWSQKLLRESKEMTDFKNNMTNPNYEGEIKNYGDTVRITTPDLSAIVIGSGVVPTTNSVYPKQITLTIDKSKNFQFKFNDIEQAQSQFNMMEGYMGASNQLMLIEVNKELIEAVIADSNVPTVGTPSAFFETDDDSINKFFNKIKATLMDNKALSPAGFYTFKGNKEQPLELAPVVTIDPFLHEALVNSSRLTHPTVQGDDILYKGVVGQIAGMKIFVDTAIKTATHADVDNNKHVVIAGTKMGITFAEQYSKVEKFRDPQTFADIGRALYLYGYKITNPKSLVVGYVETGVTSYL